MTTKYKNAQHAEVSATPRPRMHTRFGKALIAGCLALSLCPAVAYAAQPGQGGPQQGGNPPMMQQAENNGPASQQGSNQEGPQQGGNPPAAPSQDGNAPDAPSQDGNAPDMQQPNGQRPGDDAVSGQVRQILTDEYELNTAPPTDDNQQPGQPGQPGAPSEAPELPEGVANVQQIIDSTRDILRNFTANELESNIVDSDFITTLKEFAKTATEQRLAMFANNERPSIDDHAGTPANNETSLPSPGELADVSASVMSQIVSALMDAFGYATA